jgi:CBS-domain-containing membrane protein
MWQLRLGAAFAALLFKAVPCSERAKGWNVLGRGSVSALWKDW